MPAERYHGSSREGTAHPPLPPQPSMADWLNRPRPNVLQRLQAAWDEEGAGALVRKLRRKV